MICQLRLPYKDITNYVIRTSKRAMMTLEPDTTRYIPIRFPILDKYNRYIFKSDMDIVNVYFKECVLPDKSSGDSRLFSLRNVSKESITVTVLKGIRLGHIKISNLLIILRFCLRQSTKYPPMLSKNRSRLCQLQGSQLFSPIKLSISHLRFYISFLSCLILYHQSSLSFVIHTFVSVIS